MDLVLMRQNYVQFPETPFYGVCQMTWHLLNEDHLLPGRVLRSKFPERVVNEKRIRRLMRRIGLMPIYQNPIPARRRKGTDPIPICVVVCGLTAPIWYGPPTSLFADALGVPISGRHHGLAYP